MADIPEVDDLRLVLAIADAGSVGAAARSLLISQPSASSRLSRLERRLGADLFLRTTRGSSPTAAGAELIRRSRHILGHLEQLFDDVLGSTEAAPLTIGCFHTLADSVMPLLDAAFPAGSLVQRVDHGLQLVDWVAEGSMDAAVVAIAEQMTLPQGVRAERIGFDQLVVFVPRGAPTPGSGKQPLKGLQMPTASYDLRQDELRSRIIALGATPRPGATIVATMRMARLSKHAALVPRSAAVNDLHPGEQLLDLPFRWRLTLSLVARAHRDPRLNTIGEYLRRELELS
ncbi:LysR family transcriptional regulator [Psychromicrobium lacuslunae]|uniref:HTH lysR-type domain-containing protein n=1 Tax=Psychromicrobium lacuslunae TaxID=1618207 RepID=A0A0D4BX65_9MICC|nr:LysR family transcriptional regulator [Psychromicrobium lacuslunae]AJT40918.1 hypothetical protein UM93_04255 [Psychromicrobium lacuslunae]